MNGQLEDGEVDTDTLICATVPSLIPSADLVPGEGACEAGGVRIEIGRDDGEGDVLVARRRRGSGSGIHQADRRRRG